MKVKTYDAGGQPGSSVQLPDDVFDGTVNESVIHQVITAQRAHFRHGNASTKNRSAVSGGGRKPWRQKGTGRARQGTIRAGQWRGGGRIFGPSPRAYAVKIPKSVRRLAVRSALNARALSGDVALVSPIDLDAPSTKAIAALIGEIGAGESNVLLLTAGTKTVVHLSARNLSGVLVRPWGEASAYDVLWSDLVLVESNAFDEAPAVEPAVEDAAQDAAEEAAAEDTVEAAAEEDTVDESVEADEENDEGGTE